MRMSYRLKVWLYCSKWFHEICCCGSAVDTVYLNLSCTWQLHEAFIISLWRERPGVSKKSGVRVQKLDFAVMVYNNMLQITVPFKWIFLFLLTLSLEFALRYEFYLIWIHTRHNKYMSHAGSGGRKTRKCADALMKCSRVYRPHVNCAVIKSHNIR